MMPAEAACTSEVNSATLIGRIDYSALEAPVVVASIGTHALRRAFFSN
jgi:hypothetical protein